MFIFYSRMADYLRIDEETWVLPDATLLLQEFNYRRHFFFDHFLQFVRKEIEQSQAVPTKAATHDFGKIEMSI